jgi:hypothetical protein
MPKWLRTMVMVTPIYSDNNTIIMKTSELHKTSAQRTFWGECCRRLIVTPRHDAYQLYIFYNNLAHLFLDSYEQHKKIGTMILNFGFQIGIPIPIYLKKVVEEHNKTC